MLGLSGLLVNVCRKHDDSLLFLNGIAGYELPWEPRIAESVLIRMGMIIQLKEEALGSSFLLEQQKNLSVLMAERLAPLKNLICLGPKPASLSVLAFVIKQPESGNNYKTFLRIPF